MPNKDIARIFYEIADYQEIMGIEWKPIAFRRVAQMLETMDEEITEVYKKGGIEKLKELPGIGDAIAKKIEEYTKTGKIGEHEKLKKKIPRGLLKVLEVQGIGPKKAAQLYKKLRIKTIKDLEKKATEGKIAVLKGFGEKTQQDIITVLQYKTIKERMPYTKAYAQARKLQEYIQQQEGTKRVTIGGSIRRKEKTIGDIDILVTSTKPDKLSSIITKYSEVRDVIAKGPTKISIHLKTGMQADIRIVPEESYGAALQYFTGNKQHNVQLRSIAIKKGYKLSEYGLYDEKTGEKIAGETEEGVYAALGVKMPRPEKRKGGLLFNNQKI